MRFIFSVAFFVLISLSLMSADRLSFAQSSTSVPTAVGLRLPATFEGSLPCADCEGIDHALNLWPGGGFHLSRVWRGGAQDLREDAVGRWYADPAGAALVFEIGEGETLRFEVKGADRLRLLDRDGNPIESDLNYELVATAPLRDLDVQDVFVGGIVMAPEGVPVFEECQSGQAYPIAEGGDFAALSEALSGQTAPLFVQVEGALEGGAGLTVDRFVQARAGITCAHQRTTAPLFNTFWKIETLRGTAVTAPDARQEAHIVLLEGDSLIYRATVGCNQMRGSATLSGSALSFGPAAATLMACPPPLDTLERDLAEALSLTQRFRTSGDTLVLYDEADTIQAVLTAVYFK